MELRHLVAYNLMVISNRVRTGVDWGSQWLSCRLRLWAHRCVNLIRNDSPSKRWNFHIYKIFCTYHSLCILRWTWRNQSTEVTCHRITPTIRIRDISWLLRVLKVWWIIINLRFGACVVLVRLNLFSILQTYNQRTDMTRSTVSWERWRLLIILIVANIGLGLPVDILFSWLLRLLYGLAFFRVPSSDRRRLDIEIDAAKPTNHSDVVHAIIGARGVVICLVCFMIQLLFHICVK